VTRNVSEGRRRQGIGRGDGGARGGARGWMSLEAKWAE